MKLEYLDHMGSDLSIVNAARVSFGKRSDTAVFEYIPSIDRMVPIVNEKDQRLIHYLAKHGHWSPFAHAMTQFHFKAPLFVARQLMKHQVGMVWNEVSRRYVKEDPELYWPEKWRVAAENVKQGSSDEEFYPYDVSLYASKEACKDSIWRYKELIEKGLCPEQARMVLPLNTYTEWIWTGSLYAWARVFNQRTYETAQKETRDLILQLDDYMRYLFPTSWFALTEKEDT